MKNQYAKIKEYIISCINDDILKGNPYITKTDIISYLFMLHAEEELGPTSDEQLDIKWNKISKKSNLINKLFETIKQLNYKTL